jgi:hypothetical protein
MQFGKISPDEPKMYLDMYPILKNIKIKDSINNL